MKDDDEKLGLFVLLLAVYAVISYIPISFFYLWIASVWWEKWDIMTQFYHPTTEMVVGLVCFLLLPAILGMVFANVSMIAWNKKVKE
jgi:hypothetical protein